MQAAATTNRQSRFKIHGETRGRITQSASKRSPCLGCVLGGLFFRHWTTHTTILTNRLPTEALLNCRLSRRVQTAAHRRTHHLAVTDLVFTLPPSAAGSDLTCTGKHWQTGRADCLVTASFLPPQILVTSGDRIFPSTLHQHAGQTVRYDIHEGVRTLGCSSQPEIKLCSKPEAPLCRLQFTDTTSGVRGGSLEN